MTQNDDNISVMLKRTAGLLIVVSSIMYGWDGLGHMAVAYVGFQNLSPEVRQEVSRLIRLNPSYDGWIADVPIADRDLRAFMLAATWPDQIKSDGNHVSDGPCGGNRPPDGPEAGQNAGYSDNRMHKYWHFKDVPFSRDHSPLEEPPPINIQERIERFIKVLSDPKPASMSPAEFDQLKSYDLVWLLHLVGDIHQPLHCTSRFTRADKPDAVCKGDAGGNAVKISCDGCPRNLHAFWDDALGRSDDPADAITAASELDPADPDSGSVLTVSDWVQDSFELAKSKAYVSPVKNGNGPYTLNPTYIDRADSAAAAQVALAGLRLANILNQNIHR